MLAIVVCHDGDEWLSTALSALRRQRIRPRHVLAVDTGSTDRTAKILAEAGDLDGVLTLPRGTGFGTAVRAAVEHAVERWGDPGKWLWLLHDDSAPEPDCLASLLTASEVSPSAAILGPLCLDWVDPRLVVEAGISTDASGHRQTGIGALELAGTFQQSTEVLAVSSAGSLINRQVWHDLGGYDEIMPLLRDDLDFGWRANRAGHLVLCVPVARMRHVRAASKGLRRLDAAVARPGPSVRGVDRAHGMRTFLVNTSAFSFLFGLLRLPVLALARAVGFSVLRRFSDAHAEVGALGYLLSGRARLLEGRGARRGSKVVRGLFTSRLTRIRNAVRSAAAFLIRRRVEADAALGRLPASDAGATWLDPSSVDTPRPVGPAALPAGALRKPRSAGLRRPPSVVPVDATLPGALRPSPKPRPSPGPREEVVFYEVDQGRVLRSLLLAPPVLLVVGLTIVALVANSARLGLSLAGGRLLPVGDFESTWLEYLSSWHDVHGGTAAPAPAALAVLGAFPGGPQFAVALFVIGNIPLAALAAYIASRGMRVRRSVRAVVAAAYGLLPVATTAAGEGRLDVVVVHVVGPLVFAGIVAVLRAASSKSWLPIASGTALGIAALGAFSPLSHVVALIGALVGFVVVAGGGPRRIAALFAVVLLPLALLLPWPAVLLQHPSMVLDGIGGPYSSPPPNLIVCSVFAVAGFAAAVLRPNRAMLPGLAVVVLSIGALAACAAVKAWPGTPLAMLAWGLVWIVLAACRRGVTPGIARWEQVRRAVSIAGVVTLLCLAVAGFLDLRQGPVRADGGVRLAPTLSQELERTGRAVLILGSGEARQVGGRMPRFGDDEFVPTVSSPARLRRWNAEMLGGSSESAKITLAQAAASGVGFVVLPSRLDADRLRGAVGELVSEAPATSDGRPVLRVRLAANNAVLISPELARRARTGGQPPTELVAPGVSPVETGLPDVNVRVSEGPEGRLLVLAAEDEPGWRLSVDGRQVPVVRAWGHLVGVPLPATAADVRVTMSTTLRDLLLLAQAAAVLFTLLTAIPSRRR
ncbi:glycosyl transferase [Lentzea sp. NBRC 105346]|nr:glycosyl transferase [Lentzea sp. NBRC 105346]